MEWLLSLFIGSSIFGIGIALIDVITSFGEGDDSGEDSDDSSMDSISDSDISDGSEAGDSGSLVIHSHQSKPSKDIIPLVVKGLRSLVYFTLGFGPIGIIGYFLQTPPLFLLCFSTGLGLVTSSLVLLLKKLIMKTTDSQINNSDLMMETGIVIVTIMPGQVGKIRVKINGRYEDRIAKSLDSNQQIARGAKICVDSIEKDMLLVKELD